MSVWTGVQDGEKALEHPQTCRAAVRHTS